MEVLSVHVLRNQLGSAADIDGDAVIGAHTLSGADYREGFVEAQSELPNSCVSSKAVCASCLAAAIEA